MSLRGTITIECDQKDCHAEQVIGDLDFMVDMLLGTLSIEAEADGWHKDDTGKFWCPQCLDGEEADAR